MIPEFEVSEEVWIFTFQPKIPKTCPETDFNVINKDNFRPFLSCQK